MDTSYHQTIHVCGQQFTSLLFLRLLSEPCQTSMNAQFVLSRLCCMAVQQRLPGCEVSHDLVMILSTDLTTFWANSSTSGSIKQVQLHSMCFPRHFVAPHHPRPTTPMYSLVVLVKKNYLKRRTIQLASHQREHQLNYLV